MVSMMVYLIRLDLDQQLYTPDSKGTEAWKELEDCINTG